MSRLSKYLLLLTVIVFILACNTVTNRCAMRRRLSKLSNP